MGDESLQVDGRARRSSRAGRLEEGVASMATMITSECINCGACEPECPNTAIYQGAVEWAGPRRHDAPGAVAARSSTSCRRSARSASGFHDHEACAAVCPVDCCVPDPNIPETHDVLLARARVLHPEQTIPDDAPSRFTKEGAPAAGEAPDVPAETPAAAAAPAPAAPAAPAPVAKPAAKARAAGPVEKPAAGRAAPKVFAHELPGDFEHVVAALGVPRRRVTSPLGAAAPRPSSRPGRGCWALSATARSAASRRPSATRGSSTRSSRPPATSS